RRSCARASAMVTRSFIAGTLDLHRITWRRVFRILPARAVRALPCRKLPVAGLIARGLRCRSLGQPQVAVVGREVARLRSHVRAPEPDVLELWDRETDGFRHAAAH